VGGVLITGATGFLGRHVIAFGARAGLKMHVLRRDITDRVYVQQTVSALEPDSIIHLAAAGVAYGETDTVALIRTNAIGLANLLTAATALKSPPAVVCAGSGFEYAPLDRARREDDLCLPNSAYGASKVAATAVASSFASRLPVTVLRLFSLYGQGEQAGRLVPNVIARTRAGEPVDLTQGEQLRDYSDVGDVAEAFWRALDVPPQDGKLRLMNVATGRSTTLRDFCEMLAEIMCEAGFAPVLRFGARPYRPDEILNYTADVSLLKETLNWVPTTPPNIGLRRLVSKIFATGVT
jgi:UDP-glucose 4-epimerase